jgi:hypothetical protein
MTAARVANPIATTKRRAAPARSILVPVGSFDYELIAHHGPIKYRRKQASQLCHPAYMQLTINIDQPAPARWRSFWKCFANACLWDLDITESKLTGEPLANLGAIMFARLTEGVMSSIEDFLDLPDAMRQSHVWPDGQTLLIPSAGGYYQLSIEPELYLDGRSVVGLFDPHGRTIQIVADVPRRTRWHIFGHELTHSLTMDLDESGDALSHDKLCHLMMLAFQPYNSATIRDIRAFLEQA